MWNLECKEHHNQMILSLFFELYLRNVIENFLHPAPPRVSSPLLLEEPYFPPLSFRHVCQLSRFPASRLLSVADRRSETSFSSHFNPLCFSFFFSGTLAVVWHQKSTAVFSQQLWPRLDSCLFLFSPRQSDSNRKLQFVSSSSFVADQSFRGFFFYPRLSQESFDLLLVAWERCLQGHPSVLGKVNCQHLCMWVFVCAAVRVCVWKCNRNVQKETNLKS